MALTLVIGNKAYSSWSLRPWILMTQFGIRFKDVTVPMNLPETRKNMLRHGPAGQVPVLHDGKLRIWDSSAIIEYLAEKYPAKAIWPRSRAARAHARCISAEMHSGFRALRAHLPMQIRRPVSKRALTPEVEADIARIIAAWSEARKRFGKGGPFLYGKFSAADAMFAPVVNRLHIYDVKLPRAMRAYLDAVMALPAWLDWEKGARAEPWKIAHYDAV